MNFNSQSFPSSTFPEHSLTGTVFFRIRVRLEQSVPFSFAATQIMITTKWPLGLKLIVKVEFKIVL